MKSTTESNRCFHFAFFHSSNITTEAASHQENIGPANNVQLFMSPVTYSETTSETTSSAERLHKRKMEGVQRANRLYEKMRCLNDKEIGIKYRDSDVVAKINSFVKASLFHDVKFIKNLNFLSKWQDEGDIGHEVMKKVVPLIGIEDRQSWWLLYQNVVKEKLETERSNVGTRVRSVVIGNFIEQCACDIVFLIIDLLTIEVYATRTYEK